MRRLLAIVLAAGPLAAAAQTSGQILFDGSATSPTMNVAQCNGAQSSDTYTLTWTIQLTSGSTFPTGGGGEYRVFAGTGDPGNTSPFCYMPGATGQTVAEVATDPASPGVTSMTSSASVTTSALRTAAGYDCTTDKTIYVCVAWYPTTGTPDASFQGYAKGQVNLRVAVPTPPTVGPVAPGDGALYVTVKPGARVTGDATATKVRAKAVATVCPTTCDATPHYSSIVALDTTKNSAEPKISGLSNDIAYAVTAFAYADDGNVSAESDCFRDPAGAATCTTVQPVPSADAWRHYKDLGGRDSGGCDAGPAGLLALLGAAALLRLGRRS
jgi:hypothetical protein